jgi:hypothetical protein
MNLRRDSLAGCQTDFLLKPLKDRRESLVARHGNSDEQRRLVMILRSSGNSVDTIARVIGVTRTTLRKACGQELKHGHQLFKAHVVAALTRAALSGNVLAIHYWLSTRGGREWRVSRTVWSDDPPPEKEEPVVIIGPMPRDGSDVAE